MAGQGRRGRRRDGLPLPIRHHRGPDRAAAGPRLRRGRVRRAGGPHAGRVQRALRRGRRQGAVRLHHGLHTRHRLRPARPRGGAARGQAAGRAGDGERLPRLNGLRGHAVHHGCAHPHRSPRRRLPAVAGARVPVVAVPGHAGRHHGLGALGLDAAGRHDQLRRDDQLQPLRPRRRGGLDAPNHRRSRRDGARLRAVRIAPRPGGGLTWASTALETGHGRIEVSWRLDDSVLVVDTVIPEGVDAVLALDGRPDVPVPAGRSTHRGA